MVVVLCGSLVFWAGGSWAQEAPTTAEEEVTEETITPQKVQVIVVSSKDTFLVYEDQELLNFIGDMPATPAIYTKFEDLFTTEANKFIYLVDNTVLDSLSPPDITTLTQLATGGTPIGILGDGSHLKSVLGFQSAENTSVEEVTEEPQILFIYNTSDGILHEFHLSLIGNPTAGKLVKDLFKWYTNLIKNSSLTKGGDDWPLIANGSERHTMPFLIGGSPALLIDIRKDPTSTDYLVNLTLESAINDYSCSVASITGINSCGWYTSNMELAVTISNGSLKGYVPTGDVGSGSYSIQAGLPPNLGGSVSYDFTNITVRNNSSLASNKAEWSLSINGPDYYWYPFQILEPPYVAAHTYLFPAQVLITKIPDKKLKICVNAKVRMKKDKLQALYGSFFNLLSVKKTSEMSVFSRQSCREILGTSNK